MIGVVIMTVSAGGTPKMHAAGCMSQAWWWWAPTVKGHHADRLPFQQVAARSLTYLQSAEPGHELSRHLLAMEVTFSRYQPDPPQSNQLGNSLILVSKAPEQLLLALQSCQLVALHCAHCAQQPTSAPSLCTDCLQGARPQLLMLWWSAEPNERSASQDALLLHKCSCCF